MRLVVIPNHESRILPYYLAVEEWVARFMPDDDYFFAWQVAPSVICGRHQSMNLEVDMEFCSKHNIDVWRRKSGGGCVYADHNNVMFSYITPSTGVETTFDIYTSIVCRMLQSLNLNASPTGRNDIEINGMKVSGNAFYALPGRSIVHGTMLYDADFNTISQALTPSKAKLASKGVKSVPSRITTLRGQGLTMSCREFIDYTINNMCNDYVSIDNEAEKEIERIMQSYLNPNFRFDRPSKHSNMSSTRIEGVGELQFSCNIDGAQKIINPVISGDFFQLGDIETILTSKITGAKFNYEELANILSQIDVSQIIAGLNTEQLINLILKSKPKTK